MRSTVQSTVGLLIAGTLMLPGCSRGPRVWVEKTYSMEIPASELNSLTVKSHNGDIKIRGNSARTSIHVAAKCKAGGRTHESAQQCLEAIELTSDYLGERAHQIGWRWKAVRPADWSASVSFEVDAPARLLIAAESHNGALAVRDMTADCRLTTHNGAIAAESIEAAVLAETHNGGVHCTTKGPHVELVSHNGGIRVRAGDAGALEGLIKTHNGAVLVEVGERTSAELVCRTDNGRITCTVPLTTSEASKRYMRGTLGSGGSELLVQTNNGAIRIKPAGGTQ